MSSRGKAKRREKEARQAAARQGSRKGVTRLTLVVFGAIVLVGAAAAVFGGGGDRPPPPRAGAVWSAEHGHWH
jgi:hypothetical protein